MRPPRLPERGSYLIGQKQYTCRAVTKGRVTAMFDGPLMLRVNWPVVNTIHPQSTMFATGVKIKVTCE